MERYFLCVMSKLVNTYIKYQIVASVFVYNVMPEMARLMTRNFLSAPQKRGFNIDFKWQKPCNF